jgi:hypothetical protein
LFADFTVAVGAELPFGDKRSEFDGRLTNLIGEEADFAAPTIGIQAKLSF